MVFTAFFIIALLFFLLRGPYLSNSIKRILLPVLEQATGERIIIDSAVINLFPFYLQTKGFKVFDEEGNKLLHVTKMRAYIDLMGLFSKEIRIRRLTVKEPELTSDRTALDRIADSTDKYTNREEGSGFKVSLKSLKLTDGKFTFSDSDKKISTRGSGLSLNLINKKTANVNLVIEDLAVKLPDFPELSAGLKLIVKIDGDRFSISKAKIFSSGSSFTVKGEIYPSSSGGVKHGGFSGEAKIFVKTIGKMLGLKKSRDGELTLSGSVDFVQANEGGINSAGPQVKLDLKTKGWFYLETLMELLKVDENILGRISVDGTIQGVFPKVKGAGDIEVENVVLDTLALDFIKGEIRYENERFMLNDFIAAAYGGGLSGKAYLRLPEGDYHVDALVKNINSPQFFKFIAWESPFPAGKISGSFKLSQVPDRELELSANATYVNTSENIENMLPDRLRTIEADFNMSDGVLMFERASLFTLESRMYLDGSIDLLRDRLSLNVEMESDNAVDLSAPHFDELDAKVKFTGHAEGRNETPVLSGRIDVGSGTVYGEPFEEASIDIIYAVESLTVPELKIMKGNAVYDVKGTIDFRKAKELFSFADPYYTASAEIKDGDINSLIDLAFRDIPVSGLVNGKLIFEGDSSKFTGSGDISVMKGMVFNQPVDLVRIKTELTQDKISFPEIYMHRKGSVLKAGGSVYFDERFNMTIFSEHIYLRDLEIPGKDRFDADISLDLKGSGTFTDPEMQLSLNVLKSYFEDAWIGQADIQGILKDRTLSIKGDFFKGTAIADANIQFSETLPWNANVRFNDGRYDFLLAGFLKEVPRDISASLQGDVKMNGEKGKFSMSTRLKSLSFSLYGYNFTNKEDIVLELAEDTFRIESFGIIGGQGYLNAAGDSKIGQNYNFTIDGNIDLTPLQAVTSTLKKIRGQGSIAMAISGKWGTPELRGEVKIRNGATMINGLPHRIESINGDIFFDKDKVTFDSFRADLAGGSVKLSGVGHLDRMAITRLSLSSDIKGIRLRPVDDVDIAFDGKLFFETSPKKQTLLGDITITKAEYRKRVEWKSWLLKLRQTKEVPLEQTSFLGKTDLNIYIKGQDNIFIDNNIAVTPVKIDLNVQGKIAQYGLLGRVETSEGTIYFRGNEFKIIDASVDFIESSRVVPIFHIQAETTSKGYRVRLNLDGPADKFTLSLFSDPPLTDREILSLLTSGQINKGSEGLESGIGAGEATAFLTGRLQDVIEERFKYITGFERFEVDPHTTSTGAISSKITVGKRMLGEKVLVTYSSSVGSTELDVIKLQYNINDNLSIIGLRDEIGSVGGDVKFRFEFK